MCGHGEPGAKSQAVSYLGGSSDKTAQQFVKQMPGKWKNYNLVTTLMNIKSQNQ